MASVLNIVAQENENRSIVGITGELDLAGVEDLYTAFERALSDSPRELLLDLSQLAFIDCSGLAAILSLCEDCKAAEVSLRIIPGPSVRRLFEIAGVAQQVRLHDSFSIADLNGTSNGRGPEPSSRLETET